MKSKVPYCLMAVIAIFLHSCSQEELYSTSENNIKLRFENTKETDKNSDGVKTYKTKILSTSPLKIESEELEVIKVKHSETNKMSYAIVEKVTFKNKSKKYSKVEKDCESNILKGYWYDGSDCFVYGTIITDDNCVKLFIPADTATQIVMNECGWSDMA